MAEAEKIRILIVDDIADTRDNLAKLIGFEPDMEVAGTADGGQAAVNMAKKERPHVILMDINMPDMDGITATEIISNTVPESPIIMMSVQGEQDYLRRSMLAGAREFLVKPFSADELINAIRHVHELEKVKRARYAAVAPAAASAANPLAAAPAARDTGKIITFFSPKGGVGRTTIATNLAVALHQSTQKPVVLVDGSLPFGDIAVILNMSPKAKTIADLVGSFDNTDSDVLESVLVAHSTGIKVLLAPPTPESAELITGANVKHVLELLRERYAYIVVDTWPSFQEQVITMLNVGDIEHGDDLLLERRPRVNDDVGVALAEQLEHVLHVRARDELRRFGRRRREQDLDAGRVRDEHALEDVRVGVVEASDEVRDGLCLGAHVE